MVFVSLENIRFSRVSVCSPPLSWCFTYLVLLMGSCASALEPFWALPAIYLYCMADKLVQEESRCCKCFPQRSTVHRSGHRLSQGQAKGQGPAADPARNQGPHGPFARHRRVP